MHKHHLFKSPTIQHLVDEVLKSSVSDILDHSITVRTPNANIKESSTQFTIEIVAPGLQKSDFSLSVLDGKLHVSVEKPEVGVSDDTKILKREWAFNQWKRSFNLSDRTNTDLISAAYELGILTISLPKKVTEEAKSATEINIQ